MKKVLIAEDDASVAQMLKRYMERLGWAVKVASSVKEARTFKGRYQLLISDIQLPDGDGVEMAKAFRNSEPRLNFILLSGSMEAVERARASGFIVLQKPFDLRDLGRVIREA